jgi:hypothetical protein
MLEKQMQDMTRKMEIVIRGKKKTSPRHSKLLP